MEEKPPGSNEEAGRVGGPGATCDGLGPVNPGLGMCMDVYVYATICGMCIKLMKVCLRV